MSHHRHAKGEIRGARRGAPLFRALVVIPALATVVALVATLVGRGPFAARIGTSSDPSGALQLQPASTSLTLAEPRYGPPLPEVLSATSAVEMETGWAVLDRRSQQIAFLDSSGALLQVVAREGAGPGELLRASDLTRVDSFVVVVDDAGSRADLFGAEGAFRRRVHLPATACAAAPVREVAGVDGGALILLRQCTREDGSTSALVERVRFEGERDILLDDVYADVRSGTLNPLRRPLVAAVGDRVYFGIVPDPCVADITGTELLRLCHPDTNRVPMPDSLKAVFREIQPKLRDTSITVVIPERLPPFDAIIAMEGDLAFHVILDHDTHALEVVREGRLERIVLPPRGNFAVGKRSILLAQDRTEGTAFAVVRIP